MRARFYCKVHLDKLIFDTEQYAHTYMKMGHPGKLYEVYPCPANKEHFHVRDKIKRSRNHHAKKIEKRK